MKNCFVVSVVVFLLTVSLSCSKNGMGSHKRTFFRMDTVTEVTIVLPVHDDPEPIWRGIDSILVDWQERYSITSEKSEILELNTRVNSSLPISNTLGNILSMGISYGDSLQGAFDITILPIKELWGFGEKEVGSSFSIPDADNILDALKAVDYKRVMVNTAKDSVRFESPETRIDVGGIAKGFVLRDVSDYIKGRKIDNFLVAAGGDILAEGKRSDGEHWVIGIQHPRDRSALFATLELDSGSIVTSGDYERYRIVGEKRYHHIFDPRTGYSCGTNQSVTIWSMDPSEADILSTGLFCRNAAAIIEYVEARPRLEAVVIDSMGRVFRSKGWRDRIRLQR